MVFVERDCVVKEEKDRIEDYFMLPLATCPLGCLQSQGLARVTNFGSAY
jgi:hypothetical protein